MLHNINLALERELVPAGNKEASEMADEFYTFPWGFTDRKVNQWFNDILDEKVKALKND